MVSNGHSSSGTSSKLAIRPGSSMRSPFARVAAGECVGLRCGRAEIERVEARDEPGEQARAGDSPLHHKLAVPVVALDAAVDRPVEPDGGKARRAQPERMVPGAREALRSGLVLEPVGGAGGDPDDGASLADVAGEREVLDELALLLRGPAGVALAGGAGVKSGTCGAGTMSAWSVMILSLVAMRRLLRVEESRATWSMCGAVGQHFFMRRREGAKKHEGAKTRAGPRSSRG